MSEAKYGKTMMSSIVPVFRFAHTGYFTDNWELKKPIIKLTDIKYDIKNISLFEKALVLFKIFP
ncbi:hypothetical protein AYO29_01435 [Coxiella burnetii str. Schperling]|nr:hypothetical protein AYO29_01435 [Coxiella burnetii str. Schperling]